MRRRAPLILGWGVGLVLALVLLGRAGQGGLAAPPLDPRTWAAWADGRGPVEGGFALVVLAARAVAWYLLACTALTVVASVTGGPGLSRFAARVTVPLVERLVAGALGMVLVGAGVGTAASGPPRTAGADPAMVLVAAVDPTPAGDPPVMHRLAPPTSAPTAVPVTPPADTWEVAAGDHLWSVAERVLRGSWEQRPTDREVAGYWTRLVDDNRVRLADPANPDLVFPGQVLTLPAIPPPP